VNHRLPLFAFFAVLGSISASASADEASFGARGPNVIVVDHLIGATRRTAAEVDSNDGFNTTEVGTSFGLYSVFATSAPNMRLGYHRFLSESVSLGAGFQWASNTGLGSSYTILGLHPRIGVAIPLSSSSAFWLRAGGGYTHWDHERDTTEVDWSVGGEAFYVYTPVPHFGWTLGPMVDATLSATFKSRSGGETKLRRRTFGVTFGLLFDM